MTTPKCVAVMTVPRIGWNDAWGCVHEALSPWSIPIWQHNSVFWAEGLQSVMSRAIAEGADWILTIDYDTLFADRHVARLFDVMLRHSEIDALAPLQARREHHTPLGMVANKERMNYAKPLKAEAAHFGLTLLRVQSLLRTPMPWFWGIPSAQGSWDESQGCGRDADPVIRQIQEACGVTDGGKIDADSWFWRQWSRAGNSVFIDLQCRVGHLEVVCVDLIDEPRDGSIAIRPRSMSPARWRKLQREAIPA